MMLTNPVNAGIRYGQKRDLPEVLELIRELAIFEKEPDAVINTLEDMELDGFGEHPVFGFLVAEVNGAIVGISIYYTRYSTWNGKCLYLEDLIVTKAYRGRGIGTLLFEKTIAHARNGKFRLLNLQVLDWNKDAIDFYRKFGMETDAHWHNVTLRLDKDGNTQ